MLMNDVKFRNRHNEIKTSKEIDNTSKKTYLENQIQLVTLSSYDLFTDDQQDLYYKIISQLNAIVQCDQCKNVEGKTKASEEKRRLQAEFEKLIASHSGTPRIVNVHSVLDPMKLQKKNGRCVYPEGITWNTLKVTKKAAQFASEESRAMGLSKNQVTFDKIILKWKSTDILKQIVLDGFYLPILHEDGILQKRKMKFMTASAGQLRTDKIQCISQSKWDQIKGRLLCGLTQESINQRGGININKLLAYIALASSASDYWDFDIDKCIVVKDFEADVTGVVDFIDNDYNMQRCTKTTSIKHTDGCGMMLPSVSRENFMTRGPWIKGLLASFDFIQFCKHKNVPAVIKDIYGKEHDLIAEDIQVIFTQSQFKLCKYYKDWDEYKRMFKENHCTLNRTNYEQSYIADTTINYQMLQTLYDFTNEQIDTFCKKTKTRIQDITKNSKAMLEVMKADVDSRDYFNKALAVYPQFLRQGYSRNTIKSLKQKMISDAKSGRIKCANKRLFAIPDLYAACEYWFEHKESPDGLLKNGEVSCKPYRNKQKLDCLRSPHLYMQHAIRKVVKDQEIYDWFYTNGIYTSCKDLISKILQFDVDGDMLNCVADETIIAVAQRNIQKYDIVPLLYEMGKAGAKPITQEQKFMGLNRAHEFSGIGQVSNRLTKLWNRKDPDREVAAWLTFYNNLVIKNLVTV